jgi:hypothetical protein
MESKNQNSPEGDDINPVSRKTNEEIDTDDAGNLIIDGKFTNKNQSVPSDGPFSEDIPKGKNSLSEEGD